MSSRPPAGGGSLWESQAIRSPSVEFADKPNLTTDVDIPDRTPVFVGTYSHIFRGYCRGHEVAIKVIRVVTKVLSSMRRKVRREQEIWGHLDHPNIVPLYGYTEPSRLFGDFGAFISPWYENGDAGKFLQDHGPSLTIDERYMLWQGVITGVTYLHTHIPVIIHGDLKPGNILIGDEGNPRICDFGLCSLFLEDGHSGMTTTTEHAGTERYLAPELVTSPDAKPTAASDVYALGCIGLEFLFLQHPYSNLKSNRNGMIMLEIRNGTPPALRPSDLSQEIAMLWDALEACWQQTPTMRILASTLLIPHQSTALTDVGGERAEADMEAESLTFQIDEKPRGQVKEIKMELYTPTLPSTPLSNPLLSHRPFNQSARVEDLEIAIVRQQKSVELTSDGHPDKPNRLNNLGGAFEKRFDRLGRVEDLETAIAHKQKAVDLTPDAHPDKPGYLNNIGGAFEKRFYRLGRVEDLETVIAHKQKAVDLTPDDHPHKPGYLNNLGVAFETRFNRLGRLEDLETAIAHQQKAVDLTPDGHPDKPGYLNNLGNS